MAKTIYDVSDRNFAADYANRIEILKDVRGFTDESSSTTVAHLANTIDLQPKNNQLTSLLSTDHKNSPWGNLKIPANTFTNSAVFSQGDFGPSLGSLKNLTIGLEKLNSLEPSSEISKVETLKKLVSLLVDLKKDHQYIIGLKGSLLPG